MLANFKAFLTEGGVLVPGSTREGHNVITDYGREWLARLVPWETITGALDDVPYSNMRVRWIAVGTGGLVEVPGISQMGSAVTYDGVNYLCPLDPVSGRSWRTHPVPTSVKFKHEFPGVELPGIVATPAREAALFADYYDGAPTLDPTVATHTPVAYKRIDPPLTKGGAQTLTIEWELRF